MGNQRRPERFRLTADHMHRLFGKISCNHRTARLDDAGLFSGNLTQGISKEFHMVISNGSND